MNEFVEESLSVKASDGYEIACRRWRPSRGQTYGRIMILHGIQSHAGWYETLAQILASCGLDALMPDRRGSGANQVDRGHARTSRTLLSDIDSVLEAWNEVTDTQLKFRPVIAGISWGGKLALAAAASKSDRFSGLALIAPGLFAKVRPPLLTQAAIAICGLVSPKVLFPIPLSDPSLFTSNTFRQKFIETDELTLHKATARFFIVSRFMDFRTLRIATKIDCPIMVQLAGKDRIVDNERIREYVRLLPGRPSKVIEYPESHHTFEFEEGPTARGYAMDLADWVIERSACESLR
jgi:acylglycerol lipase